MKYDIVKITNEGRYSKAVGSIGEILRIGKGSRGNCHLTISIHGMEKQICIAKHVKFIQRPVDELVKEFNHTNLHHQSSNLQDFHGGKH